MQEAFNKHPHTATPPLCLTISHLPHRANGQREVLLTPPAERSPAPSPPPQHPTCELPTLPVPSHPPRSTAPSGCPELGLGLGPTPLPSGPGGLSGAGPGPAGSRGGGTGSPVLAACSRRARPPPLQPRLPQRRYKAGAAGGRQQLQSRAAAGPAEPRPAELSRAEPACSAHSPCPDPAAAASGKGEARGDAGGTLREPPSLPLPQPRASAEPRGSSAGCVLL